MWIKKTNEEIQKERKKGIKDGILFFSIFVFLVGCIGFKLGLPSRSNPAGTEPMTWQELFSAMPFLLVFSVILSTFVVLGGRNMGKKTVLCEKCHNTKFKDANTSCQCGGKYVDISTMKWVDDKNM